MLKDKKTILAVIILGFIFSFFYNTIVIRDFKDFQIKLKEVNNAIFSLPEKDAYLLKIWGISPPKEIYFNNEPVTPFYSRERSGLKEFYISLSPEIVNEGDNRLEIASPDTYSVRIKNCLGSLEQKQAIILFANSKYFKRVSSLGKLLFLTIFISLTLAGVWCLVFWSLQRFFNISLRKFFFRYWFSYLPCLFLFLAIFLFSLSPYKIVFLPRLFIVLSILLVGVIQCPVVSWLFLKEFKNGLQVPQGKLRKEGLDLPDGYRIIGKYLPYIKHKPADNFIIASIFFLLMSTILLAFRLESISESVAVIAYLTLTIGTVMKAIKFFKEEGRVSQK